MAELADALRRNWEGREDLRLAARRSAPKWGNNDDLADMAARLEVTVVPMFSPMTRAMP